MNSFNDYSERFLKVVDELGVSDYSVWNSIDGISKEQLSKIRRGVGGASLNIIRDFCSHYESANADYILTGRGEPLKQTMEVTQIHHPKSFEKKDGGEVVLYDIEAAANLNNLFLQKDQNVLGKISIPNIPKCDGAIYVRGDSMYPLLKSGDIVAYKEIQVDMRQIIFGEMYLVSIDMDGDEYLAVKYVKRSEFGKDWIQLASYNQHHEPKDFHISVVRAMALVKLSIRMNTMR